MRIFDFFTSKNSLVLALIIILGACLIAAVLSFLLLNRMQSKFKRRAKDKSNTVRVYVISLNEDKVEYFNSSKLRNKKVASLNAFYSHFSSSEREDIISWINNLAEGSDGVRNFMEVSAYVKRFKRNIPSILQVQKVNVEKKLVYLESYLLNPDEIKEQKNVKKTVSIDRLSRLVRRSGNSGCCFCINFFNKQTMTDEISSLAYAELKNIVTTFVEKDVHITELDKTRFLLVNYSTDDKIKALEFAENLMIKLNSYIGISSFEDEISISIGVAECKFFTKLEKKLFDTVVTLSENAKDNEKHIVFFDETRPTHSDDAILKTEIENILDNNNLRYFYQPIYNLKYSRCTAYISTIQPVDSSFANIDDLKQFASRGDDSKKLLLATLKNSISNFAQERGNVSTSLFVPILVNEIKYVGSSLRYIPFIKDTKIVFVLKEKDINTIPNEEDKISSFIESLRTIKSKGFPISLEIDDNILNLSTKIYELFDYFEIKVSDFIGKKKKTEIPVFKGLVESLLRYEKPIVAINIPSWDAVELIYKFGFTNICGDPIAEKNENIIPLDKKVIQKLKKLVA